MQRARATARDFSDGGFMGRRLSYPAPLSSSAIGRRLARDVFRSPLVLILALIAAPLHAQWVAQRSGTASEFRGLEAVSDQVVWAAGKGGVVALTEDGGATWRADSIPGAGGLFLIAVRAWDARRAWVAGTAFSGPSLGRIYRTEDGGRHWAQQYESAAPGVFLDGMAFWDERHGIAFGDPIDHRLFVLTTEDGGAHWMPLASERAPAMAEGEAAFAASGTAIFVRGNAEVWIATGGGPHARVLHSRDRGASWDAVDTPVTGAAAKGLFGIAIGNEGRGVAVGGDYRQREASAENLLLTGDGGTSWRLPTSP